MDGNRLGHGESLGPGQVKLWETRQHVSSDIMLGLREYTTGVVCYGKNGKLNLFALVSCGQRC